jgi:asparagine synthase (glutamine-hydrolysing)
MCGIAGWYNRDGRPVDARLLTDMSDRMIHRGPDDHAIWLSGSIGLAHRRLSIRDLSSAGRQPMSDAEQRVFVTYNGEIYNDRLLRAELERDFGFRFRTSCDTEVLPYAYLAWGDDMFERLEGMFAIGLWDVANERLVLARDGIGIKPVLFADTGSAVVFASEMKGVLASGLVSADLDSNSLHTFLAAGHAGPSATLVTTVEQVPPGSIVAFSRAGRHSMRYWQPRRSGDIVDMETAVDLVSRTLDEVVGDQLVSDVPLSILQSGGIDSSLISLSVGRTGAKPPLFTASFDEPSHDEVDLARQVADVAGLSHRVVPVHAGQGLDRIFRSMVHHFDGQCADTGALGFYCLAEAVRKHSTVVLSGDGGDEFFGGYETYAATRVAELVRRVTPVGLARVAGQLAYRASPGNEGRLPGAALVARFASGIAEGGSRPHLQWRRLIPAPLLPDLYGPAMRELASTSPYREYAAHFDAASGHVLDRAMLADQQFHLQSVLAKVDAMSMAHSLEVRVPLLDRRIMELAGRIQLRLLSPWNGAPKRVLRDLARRLGAPAGVTRARKKGFNVPIARLLRGDLRSLAEQMLDRDADVTTPYLRPDSVRALWRAHRDGRTNHAFALWPILTVATWRAGLAEPPRRSHAGSLGMATAAV